MPTTVLVAGAVLMLVGVSFGFVMGQRSSVNPNRETIATVPIMDTASESGALNTPLPGINETLPSASPLATLKPTPTPTPKPKVETTGISLSVVSNEPGQAKLSWSSSLEASSGWKAVWSEHDNPTYPQDSYHFLSDPNTRSETFTDLPSGKTLHFRVGIWHGGDQAYPYSNDVSVTIK